MKDDNGAIRVGASYQIPEETVLEQSNIDYMRMGKDHVTSMLGEEIAKHFEIHVKSPPWLSGKVLHTEMVVMSIEDYDKLKEDAWKYRDLSK